MGVQFQAPHIWPSRRWQLPLWGGSFFLLPKAEGEEKRVKTSPQGMRLVPPGVACGVEGALQVGEVLQEFLHPRGIRIHADPL